MTMSVHSWHHHTRWPEMHPLAYRKYQQRKRRDDLRNFGKLCLGAAVWLVAWFCIGTLVPLAVMWVWR
jgi:hypothetical protein